MKETQVKHFVENDKRKTSKLQCKDVAWVVATSFILLGNTVSTTDTEST